MHRRSHVAALALALTALLAVLAGCGGSSRSDTTAAPVPKPQLDPPEAAEPAKSPDTAPNPAGRIVRLGGPVEGLVADGKTGLLAAARRDRPVLVLAALPSGGVRRRVPLPAAPRHLALQRPGGPVLVPAENANVLAFVALPGGAVRTVKVGEHPHDAVALGGRVFTGDEFSGTVTEVEGGRRVRDVPVDVQPGGLVAVGGKLGVVSVRAYTFELFDPDTLRGGGSQAAGLGPSHAVADRSGRVYITDTRGDALTVFATRPRLKFLARVSLKGSPYGIAADDEHGRLWVTLVGRNRLVELSLGDHPRILRALRSVVQPNSVAVDPRTGTVAVASAREDTLQLIGP